jgi:hypothetical protein
MAAPFGQAVPVVDRLHPDESGLRRLIADAHGASYHALASLTEAKLHADGVVVLEGDDGGQVYAVFPARAVQCDTETLDHLLRDLDAIAWPGNDRDSARVFYERHPPGARIAGGMGGGVVDARGWVHQEFRDLQLDDQIREVIAGQRDRVRRT